MNGGEAGYSIGYLAGATAMLVGVALYARPFLLVAWERLLDRNEVATRTKKR